MDPDLHLDPEQPDINRHFVDFLETRARRARVLYILGDLFEIWLGDDDDPESLEPALSTLRRVARDTRVYLMHGNRDFLIGDAFARNHNLQLIDEPHLITLGDQRIALMHGDLLCTDDAEYQDFRARVRTESWQRDFLSRPLSERRDIARSLRRQSSEAMRGKADNIMDVNAQAVEDYFGRLRVDGIIHGHTHRPGIHSIAKDRTRYVLGDWRPEPSFLRWSAGNLSLHDRRCP